MELSRCECALEKKLPTTAERSVILKYIYSVARAGCSAKFVNGDCRDHDDGRASDDPSEHVGPSWIRVAFVAQRFVVQEPVNYYKHEEKRCRESPAESPI